MPCILSNVREVIRGRDWAARWTRWWGSSWARARAPKTCTRPASSGCRAAARVHEQFGSVEEFADSIEKKSRTGRKAMVPSGRNRCQPVSFGTAYRSSSLICRWHEKRECIRRTRRTSDKCTVPTMAVMLCVHSSVSICAARLTAEWWPSEPIYEGDRSAQMKKAVTSQRKRKRKTASRVARGATWWVCGRRWARARRAAERPSRRTAAHSRRSASRGTRTWRSARRTRDRAAGASGWRRRSSCRLASDAASGRARRTAPASRGRSRRSPPNTAPSTRQRSRTRCSRQSTRPTRTCAWSSPGATRPSAATRPTLSARVQCEPNRLKISQKQIDYKQQ